MARYPLAGPALTVRKQEEEDVMGILPIVELPTVLILGLLIVSMITPFLGNSRTARGS